MQDDLTESHGHAPVSGGAEAGTRTDAATTSTSETEPPAGAPVGPSGAPEGSADMGGEPLTSDVDQDTTRSEIGTEPGNVTEAVVGDAPEGGSLPDEWMAALGDRVHQLVAETKRFHARAEHQEQLVRQMQGRIEELQGDQVRVLLKPLIQQLAALHAHATEAESAASERGDESEKDFSYFATKLEESLSLLDIDSVDARTGRVFDPKLHHAKRVVPTQDVTLDRCIQRVLRQGFIYAGSARPLLPAQVSIFKFEGAPAETSPTTNAPAQEEPLPDE